jgi:hypothetical protein
MLSSGWNIALDYDTSNEVDVVDNDGGVQAGAFNYNGGAEFQLNNTTGGDTYEFVVIGWDNQGGDSTLEQAMNADIAIGWSGAFNYTTGAGTQGSVVSFTTAGETAFGIAPVPEPTPLALAGLGGLSLFFLRRRKS